MNFNYPNNFKLRKTFINNKSQYSAQNVGPLNRHLASMPLFSSNTVNQLASPSSSTSSNTSNLNNFKLVKTNPRTTTASKPNVLPNASANLFVMQSLESSNKLDDLLKRCREIGKSDKTPGKLHII